MTTAHAEDTKDYRKRYVQPLGWGQDEHSTFGIDHAGYMSLILDVLEDLPPCHLLDAGCGDGRLAYELVKLGHDVVGLDYSERAVAFAQAFVPNARFETCDLRDLDVARAPHLREVFDAALLIETIEHVPIKEHGTVLQNVRRCLKPRGRLVLSTPSVHLASNEWHYKHFTVKELTDLLYTAGFGVERILFQHRVSPLFRHTFWRFIHNRAYDLTFVRKSLRRRFLSAYNVTDRADKAGRYIFVARSLGEPALANAFGGNVGGAVTAAKP